MHQEPNPSPIIVRLNGLRKTVLKIRDPASGIDRPAIMVMPVVGGMVIEFLTPGLQRTGERIGIPMNRPAEFWLDQGGRPNSRVHCAECGADIRPGKPGRRCHNCRREEIEWGAEEEALKRGEALMPQSPLDEGKKTP